MAERTDHGDRRRGAAIQSRRGLLTGAAGALGVLAAESIATAQPAAAVTFPPVLFGADNSGATTATTLSTTTGQSATLADPGSGIGVLGTGTGNAAGVTGGGAGVGPGVSGFGGASNGPGVSGTGGKNNGPGVMGTGGNSGGNGVEGFGTGNGGGVTGLGAGDGTGVTGQGGPNNGGGVTGVGTGFQLGVFGRGGPNGGPGVGGAGGTIGGSGASNGVEGFAGNSGDGVSGSSPTGNGVRGTATAAAGVGVLAENTAGGVAFQVTGPAVFSRSGILTVAAGKSSATKTGVALTGASLVLATLQHDQAGVYVRSAVPNVASSSFTLHLSKAVTRKANVAWFVVN
jgi:hypothetical protein